MNTNLLIIFKNLRFFIPDKYDQEFNKTITGINAFRVKFLCLGCIFLGLFLFLIDFKMNNTQGQSDLHHYYLWSDAMLFGLGLLFYILLIRAQKYHDEKQQFQDIIIISVSLALLSWCGGVSAVEYFTHNSVSTLIIGALILASGLYIKGWHMILIYGTSIVIFIICKTNLNPVPINFFTEHLNLIGLTVFGWLLSRILYINKAETFLNQQKILENNKQLANEINIRNKAQSELKKTQKMLEQSVLERTQELLTVNTELRNEIFERKKMENSLQQSQRMESIGTLAGGIAHDFNNILFPILGYTEMLIDDTPDNSSIKESLNEIYSGVLRAKDLIKQILTFSRQDKSELKLIKLQPIIIEALKLIRSAIPTTIEIEQDIQSDCGIIKADPTQIHQVVMNLTTNAYHAMYKKGGKMIVNLKEIEFGENDLINPDMASGAYACLTVSDTGEGMDKGLTEKIFDPFFTTKEIGKGTGMGLSVVHGIIKGMSGAIQVHSEPDKGTQFNVYFPIKKARLEEQHTEMKEHIQGGNEQILLVDDEEAIITMEKQMLERLGYQVTSRTSSVEALEAFRNKPDDFDLVITDMTMPNISGDKFAIELNKIRVGIPILLCTGFSETISKERATSMGINGFLMKPIIKKDLAEKVREILD